MNIHEFQGKSLLSQFDIPVQPGIVLDLESNLASLKTLSEQADEEPVFAVKAQIHAGGRGKGKFKEKDAGDGGGVRILKNAISTSIFPSGLLAMKAFLFRAVLSSHSRPNSAPRVRFSPFILFRRWEAKNGHGNLTSGMPGS